MAKHPWVVLGLGLALTIFFALGIPRLKFDSDVRSMLPEGNSDVAVNNYYEGEDRFGNSNLIFVGVESKDAYSPEALAYVRNLQTRIEALNDTLPTAGLAVRLGLTADEADRFRQALGSLEWNAGNATPGPIVEAAGAVSPSVGEKVSRWLADHPAADLYHTWEPPVKKVQSITGADDIVNDGDTLKIQKLVEGELTPENVSGLRAKVAGWPLYQNVLVSADGTLATLMITVANSDKTVQTSVDQAVDRILEESRRPGFTTYLDGESVIGDQIGVFMFADIRLLMPLVVLLVLGILFLCFKRWEGVVFPAAVILVTGVWAVGLMAWTGVPMNVVSVAMPVLLVAISSAYAIHQMNHYLLGHRMKTVALAITLSGITVMVGFGALVIEKFVPIRNFGLFTAAGDLFAVGAALVLLPALLTAAHKPRKPAAYDPHGGFFGRILDTFSGVARARPGTIIVLVIFVTGIFAAGSFFVKSELNSVSFFKDDTPIRAADDKLNEKLAGTQTLNVIVDSDLRPVLDRDHPPADGKDTRRDLADPEVLKTLDAFAGTVLAKYPFVTKAVSFNDFLKKMNQVMEGGDPAQYRIPDDKALVSQYLLIYSGDLQPVLTAGHDKLRVTLTLKRTTSQQVEEVRQFALSYFGDSWCKAHRVQVQVTGTAHLYNVANDLLVHGNIESLYICLTVVFLLLFLVLRSFWMSLVALVPIFLTLAVNFGVLGFLGIPLNTGTAMVSSIAIGIGVDYSIHYITWYRSELRNGLTVSEAVGESILHKGRAILYNMFVIVGGFVVLAFSSFVPLVQFGLLVSLCMVTTALGALVAVPAVLHFLARFNLRFLRLGVEIQGQKPV